MFERIGSLRMADSTRAEFDDSVTEHDLRQLAERPKVKTLQCSAPVENSVWSLVNESFFSLRPDVELRVYGHYSIECDLAFTPRMVNVRRFAADRRSSRRARAHFFLVMMNWTRRFLERFASVTFGAMGRS